MLEGTAALNPAGAAPGTLMARAAPPHRAEVAPGAAKVPSAAAHQAAEAPGTREVVTAAPPRAEAVHGVAKAAMAAPHPAVEGPGVAKAPTEAPTITILTAATEARRPTAEVPTTRAIATRRQLTATTELTMAEAIAPTIPPLL